MNNIGETIKKYRLEKNLTQEELGKTLFVSKQAVSKWENGKTLPDIITIKKLAELLSIPHEEILGESIQQTRQYKKWIRILIPIAIISLFVTVFFAFDGVGIIQRRMQSGVAVVTLHENSNVVAVDEYQIAGVDNLKPGYNGYSFSIDYGEVKGIIITANGEEIEFGFINTNNWHNVQISISINTESNLTYVSQYVIYKTDNDFIEVIENKTELDENKKASVFRDGV